MTSRALSRGLIILFCLWHMFAVAVYAVPDGALSSGILDVRNAAYRVISPYVLLTSQWQMWNLFSPDPLRRVVEYRIEKSVGNKWQVLRILTPASSRWWRRTHEFSLLRRMEDVQAGSDLFRSRYIQAYCPSLNVPSGTPIRLVFRSTVLPQLNPHHDDQALTWTENVGVTTACPDPAVTAVTPGVLL